MRLLKLHIVCLILFAIMGIHNAVGQDIHFSQFNQSPARLNPALTGQFDGKHRVAGIYRSQWASVTVPYTTISFSGDVHNFLQQKGLGMGADLYFDQAGDGNLGTFNVNLSSSYTLELGVRRNHKITMGMQLGWAQKQIDPTKLVFDNQMGGGNSLESFATSTNYANANAGVVWQTKLAERKKILFGVALHNLTQPNINLYGNDDSKLDLRFTIHGQYQFKISDKVDLIPGFLTMIQGPHQQITPGINAKYILDDRSNNYRAVYAGLWTRTADAGFMVVGMDWNTLNVSVSYDVNYSSLQQASRYRGGFEMSLIYIFRAPLPARQYFKTCPNFI